MLFPNYIYYNILNCLITYLCIVFYNNKSLVQDIIDIALVSKKWFEIIKNVLVNENQITQHNYDLLKCFIEKPTSNQQSFKLINYSDQIKYYHSLKEFEKENKLLLEYPKIINDQFNNNSNNNNDNNIIKNIVIELKDQQSIDKVLDSIQSYSENIEFSIVDENYINNHSNKVINLNLNDKDRIKEILVWSEATKDLYNALQTNIKEIDIRFKLWRKPTIGFELRRIENNNIISTIDLLFLKLKKQLNINSNNNNSINNNNNSSSSYLSDTSKIKKIMLHYGLQEFFKILLEYPIKNNKENDTLNSYNDNNNDNNKIIESNLENQFISIINQLADDKGVTKFSINHSCERQSEPFKSIDVLYNGYKILLERTKSIKAFSILSSIKINQTIFDGINLNKTIRSLHITSFHLSDIINQVLINGKNRTLRNLILTSKKEHIQHLIDGLNLLNQIYNNNINNIDLHFIAIRIFWVEHLEIILKLLKDQHYPVREIILNSYDSNGIYSPESNEPELTSFYKFNNNNTIITILNINNKKE